MSKLESTRTPINRGSANGDIDNLFKVLLVGDSSVGKSAIMMRFTDDNFFDGHVSTIGADFKTKKVTVSGKKIALQLWDTAGQERFRTMTNAYYRGAHGLFIVYDITNRESFEHVKSWLEEVRRCTDSSVSVMLLGNKSDLNEKRSVSLHEVYAFTKKHNLSYLETSARDATNIGKAFLNLTKQIMRISCNKNFDKEELTESIMLHDQKELPTDKTSTKWCCY